jgi:hypothetical protein
MVGAFADGMPWTMGWVIASFGIGSALYPGSLYRRRPCSRLVHGLGASRTDHHMKRGRRRVIPGKDCRAPRVNLAKSIT